MAPSREMDKGEKRERGKEIEKKEIEQKERKTDRQTELTYT
jgi:hypothetical protein